MSARPSVLELIARLLVGAASTANRHRGTVACLGLVMSLVGSAVYVAHTARLSPYRDAFTVRILLPESGGLLTNQEVTLRGVPIGRIVSIAFRDNGVLATADIKNGTRIPRNSHVRVSALSPAGEQYLDFQPGNDDGPLLADGNTIDQGQTSIPVPLAALLEDADGFLAQIDADKLAAINAELRVSHQGPRKLAALLDGGAFLISTLDSVMPQSVSTIRNSQMVLDTVGDTAPGLRRTAAELKDIMGGVNTMSGGFQTLVKRGGAPLTALDNLIADNSDTMVQLLGNLVTIAQLSYVRVPALQALFPDNRGSVLDSLAGIIHDGGIWGLLQAYPRYACDFNLPRRPPSVPDFVEPYRYTYCPNMDPSVLVRGARNAPRPPGDDTAGPPAGQDPLAQTDPTPIGPDTIGTTYGGPNLPQNPPN